MHCKFNCITRVKILNLYIILFCTHLYHTSFWYLSVWCFTSTVLSTTLASSPNNANVTASFSLRMNWELLLLCNLLPCSGELLVKTWMLLLLCFYVWWWFNRTLSIYVTGFPFETFCEFTTQYLKLFLI